MVDLIGHAPSVMGLANVAVLTALLNHLVKQNVLNRSEVNQCTGCPLVAPGTPSPPHSSRRGGGLSELVASPAI
jgi:hypothetical protein